MSGIEARGERSEVGERQREKMLERTEARSVVEADRREQLGRAQAAAERPIERRQGLGVGTSWGKRLVDQARGLRERIGREVGRVKDWVREQFPDPLKSSQGPLARGVRRGHREGPGPGAGGA